MNYSKFNKYKIPIIVASVFLFIVAVGAVLFISHDALTAAPFGFAQTDLKVKGNRNSKIYHLPACPNYADIKESNVVWFKTEDEAKTAGFRRAKNC